MAPVAAMLVAEATPRDGVTRLADVKFALRSSAVCVAVLTGFEISLVLFTFPNPTIVAVMPDTVPVNVGEANGAFNATEETMPFIVFRYAVPLSVNAC